MPGRIPRVNPLQLRKALLVAESELNRAQLAGELAALQAGARTITGRFKCAGSIASSAVALVTGLVALRRGHLAERDAKPSWLQTILKGAGLISNLWLAFRPPGEPPTNSPNTQQDESIYDNISH